MKVIRISQKSFEERRLNDYLDSDVIYRVSDKSPNPFKPEVIQYGWSPDGIGVIWYDSLAEAKEAL